VLTEFFPKRTGGIAWPRQCLVDPPEQERQPLAKVPEDHLEFGIGLKQTAEHHAHALRRGFHREPERRPDQFGILRQIVLVVDLDNGRMRERGVQIDRHVERGRALEDRPEPLVIDEKAVGEAVDHRTLEAELCDGALKFIGGRLRVGRRQDAECGKTLRIGFHNIGQTIIGLAGQAHRRLRFHFLRAGRAVRQHLHINTGVIHFLDAQIGNVLQTFFDLGKSFAFTAGKMRHQVAIPIMLFKCNNKWRKPVAHDAYSPMTDLHRLYRAVSAHAISRFARQ